MMTAAKLDEAGIPLVRGLSAVPRHFKVAQLAARLNVKPKTVRRWVRAGEFPGAVVPPDGPWLIPEDDVQAFLTRHRWHERTRKGTEVPSID